MSEYEREILTMEDVDLRPFPLTMEFGAAAARLSGALTPHRLDLIRRAAVAFDPNSPERREYEAMVAAMNGDPERETLCDPRPEAGR